MVTSSWSPKIAEAVRMSAAIENAGQCTALRHLVAPVGEAEVTTAFDELETFESSGGALEKAQFAGLLEGHPFRVADGYKQHPKGLNVGIKTSTTMPGDDIDEMWRQVYVDATEVSAGDMEKDKFAKDIGDWLVKHQPISLAVNGAVYDKSFALMRRIFDRSGLVVNTVGAEEAPALTAQARPQDAEIFGEFPPRLEMTKYSKFPVVGPSSTPGYNTTYNLDYLAKVAEKKWPQMNSPPGFGHLAVLLQHVTNVHTKGYLGILGQYIAEAACGPRRGHGERSTLWGLQRPPLDGKKSVIRIERDTSFDDASTFLLPFLMTNAKDQCVLSVDPANAEATAAATALKDKGLIEVRMELPKEFAASVAKEQPWNVINPTPCDYSLVGHHTSLIFSLGHVKCTRSNDESFYKALGASNKWLRKSTTAGYGHFLFVPKQSGAD
jgi:hypothetical protein